MHKLMLKRKKELRASEEVWLNLRFSQSSLELSVLSFFHDESSDGCATCLWEIFECLLVVPEDLPHTYSCTCLFDKETKTKAITKALPFWTPGSLFFSFSLLLLLNFFIILLLVLLSINLFYYYFYILFLFVHQTLYTQARLM